MTINPMEWFVNNKYMKKRESTFSFSFLLLIFILVFCVSYKLSYIKADSGFDASYDSGSSWDFSSRNSSYDFNNSSLVFTPMSAIIVAIFMLVLVIILIIKLKKTNSEMDRIIAQSLLSENDIHNRLPNLDIQEFNAMVFNNYKAVQIAWINFELESVRNLISDELYNMYIMQLETLKIKGQKNIMKNIEYVSNNIVDIKIENNVTTIKTKLVVTCNDYIINKKNRVIRGKKNKKLEYIYKLTFIQTDDNNINYCPNCGAKLDINSTNKCKYCNSIVIQKPTKWIMTKKQI